MKNNLDICIEKVYSVIKKRKLFREILEEFFNHGIGYFAGLLAYNYLTRFIEAKGIKNLWGFANHKKKILVSKNTFENIEFVISAIVGFIIFKIVTHYSRKIWEKYEQNESDFNKKNTEDINQEKDIELIKN